MEKLSSGYRINTGMDAPADLVISEQLHSQISGINRAIRNTTESINVLAIAEGALNEMHNIRMKRRGLAIHAANSGITSPELIAADQSEMDSGIQALERIAGTTQFSDQYLINSQKQIAYSSNVNVKRTQNNRRLKENLSDFVQIFKRQGYSVSFVLNGAALTNGEQQGLNSDQTGKIYIKMEWGDSGTVTAYAYKDGLMRPGDMVAKTMAPVNIAGTPGSNTILLDSIWNDEHGLSTGISLALAIPGDPSEADSTSDLYLPINTIESFDIEFNHRGVRIYASEYDSQQFLQMQPMTG
jgi:flagellin-like hook-associated protein FlgL